MLDVVVRVLDDNEEAQCFGVLGPTFVWEYNKPCATADVALFRGRYETDACVLDNGESVLIVGVQVEKFGHYLCCNLKTFLFKSRAKEI